mmetsp:Transcript_1253/g.1832  ORF Transcript_1253/g.1832 Transcript_1253/m.1832 type:complete len:202 (-) Transcript_1253:176-781(-)
MGAFILSKVSAWADSAECRARECLSVALSTCNLVGQRELDSLLGELHSIWSLQILSFQNCSANDLDGTWSSAVSTSHLVIQLRDRSSQGQITILTVHIVGTATRIISDPNTVVLYNPRILFHQLNTIQNLTGCFLHLAELVQVVPELGLCNNWVWSEDDHPVGFRIWVVFSGSMAAYHLVPTHNSRYCHFATIRFSEGKNK